jgi:PleD family two-component response regulator
MIAIVCYDRTFVYFDSAILSIMPMKKLLIVDDNTDTLEILATVLSSEYEVKAVESRDDALAAINDGFKPSCARWITKCRE